VAALTARARRARLADHARLVPALAAVSAADGAMTVASTGGEAK